MVGKQIRMERIMDRESGNYVIVPMDHGISSGPINGLEDLKTSVDLAAEGANAVVLHKGMVEEGYRGGKKDIGLIVHLSASTSLSLYSNKKTLICNVEEAIKLGADAVSIHVNIGTEYDSDMLRGFGEVVDKCRLWGMPLLAMMYARGPSIANEYDAKLISHVARIGAEMGADVIKVPYTGEVESFKKVVKGCPKPIVIAGGPKKEEQEERNIFEMIKGSLDAGGKGVSIGRNVFQHKYPGKMINLISGIVHRGWSVDAAMEFFDKKMEESLEEEAVPV